MTDPDLWDVAIVGAGPAGSAAALAALKERPDAKVVLLDKSDFPRDKTCGDGIAPHAVDVLTALGAADPTVGYAPVQTLHLVGPKGSSVARRMTRPAKIVPRMVLDARIGESAVIAGAVLRQHTVRAMDVRPDRVVLDGAVNAKAVVGADGVNGVVRRAMGLPPNPPQAMAIAMRAYAETPVGAEAEQYMVMSGTGWPAYAWSFPIGDGTSNVGYGMVLEGDATPSRGELEDELHRLLPGLGRLRGTRAHRLPLSTWRPTRPDGRVVLAGDAASLINPFTGEGIYYAVLSGAVAGSAALYGDRAGQTARATLDRHLRRHLRGTSIVARLGTRPAVVDAGIRAAGNDQRVFDDLVEQGLGAGLLTGRSLAGTAQSLLAQSASRMRARRRGVVSGS